ncbi:hypothetical protein DL93DRAFT_1098670 [Clavulina sp. PMI_390]|nr:hypothetical protein DL93DRAFT_1098670 [Clavulina sp. PMI_390]
MILEGREQGDSQHPRPAHMRMPHLSRFHPTPVQVRRFASGQSTGPARGLFSLRFSASGSDQWNRAAFERFLERHYPQGPSEDQRDAAAEYFETFIRSLRRARAQRQAAEGDEAGAEEQRGLRAENQRTYSLAWSRVETARTIPALRQFVPLLTALGPDGTSDDERQLEDDVHVMWYIRPVAWRDPRIRPLLDMIDHITSTLAETDLRVDRRGNRRRRRLPGGSARARNRSVPIGLPLSLYNQQWLNRLPQPERQFLEQQATDEISLAVPEELYA